MQTAVEIEIGYDVVTQIENDALDPRAVDVVVSPVMERSFGVLFVTTGPMLELQDLIFVPFVIYPTMTVDPQVGFITSFITRVNGVFAATAESIFTVKTLSVAEHVAAIPSIIQETDFAEVERFDG